MGGLIMDNFQVATPAFTVEFWTKSYTSSPTNMIYDFRPTSTFYFSQMQEFTVPGLQIPAGYFGTNTWTHVALSWNRNIAQVFINGTLYKSATGTTTDTRGLLQIRGPIY